MISSFTEWIQAQEVAASIVIFTTFAAAYGLFQQYRARRETAQLRREAQTISWDDIRIATDELARQIRSAKARTWRPDYIFSFSSRGGIVCEMLARTLCPGVPQFIAITVHKSERSDAVEMAGFHRLDTLKWHVYVPHQVELFHQKRVLLIDDYVQGGTAIRMLKRLLADKQIAPREMITCAVVKASSAVSLTDKIPDFYWIEKTDHRFFWPWGLAR